MVKPNSHEPKVTLEIALDHGLTEEEFGFIKKNWVESQLLLK